MFSQVNVARVMYYSASESYCSQLRSLLLCLCDVF